MSLFDIQKTDTLNKKAPLAQRMRPQNLDEILGQDHIIGPGFIDALEVLARLAVLACGKELNEAYSCVITK